MKLASCQLLLYVLYNVYIITCAKNMIKFCTQYIRIRSFVTSKNVKSSLMGGGILYNYKHSCRKETVTVVVARFLIDS